MELNLYIVDGVIPKMKNKSYMANSSRVANYLMTKISRLYISLSLNSLNLFSKKKIEINLSQVRLKNCSL